MSSLNKLNFVSDENVPVKLAELLIENGFDVLKTPIGSTDKEISKISRQESRIILTFDKHFINKNLFNPKEHPGIVLIQIHPPLIDKIFHVLKKLLDSVEEFDKKLFILSEQGFKIR